MMRVPLFSGGGLSASWHAALPLGARLRDLLLDAYHEESPSALASLMTDDHRSRCPAGETKGLREPA
jgi:hypothetical protein